MAQEIEYLIGNNGQRNRRSFFALEYWVTVLSRVSLVMPVMPAIPAIPVILVLLSVFSLNVHANERSCRDLFSSSTSIISSDEYKQQKDDSDEDARWVRVYKTSKKRISENENLELSRGDNEKSDVLLAWLESRAQQRQFKVRVSNELDHLETQGFFVEKMSIESKKKKISARKIELLMYRLLTDIPNSRWGRFKGRFTPDIEAKIHNRVAAEILTGDLMTAFDRLGLNVKPHSREKLLARLNDGGGKSWILSSAINVLMTSWQEVFAGNLAWPILYLPKAKFEQGVALPEKLKQKIYDQGFDAAKDELLKHFHVPAQATWVWNLARYTYYVATILVFLESTADVDAALINAAWTELWKLNPDRPQIPTAMGSKQAEELILKGWIQWFTDVRRRPPTEQEIQDHKATHQGWTFSVPSDK